MSGPDVPRFGERRDPESAEAPRVEGRPAPGYGEYAPAGWVSPVTLDEPRSQGLTAQDPRRPDAATTTLRSGQAPTGFTAPPPTGAPVPGRPPVSVRATSFNRYATLMLLFYGVFNIATAFSQESAFASMYIARFTSFGYLRGTFESRAALEGIAAVSASASVVIFIAAAVWAIRRLRTGRRSWVILLVAGLAVNLATGIAVVFVIMHDPSFVGLGTGAL
jgi:uncharacterized membrane protein YhaH (DUF805 family)